MKDIKIQRYEFVEKDIKEYISGFTLIELLVTISIIAILLGFVSARYITIEKQARDTRRKSDLSQYRIALENYASVNNSLYPTPAGGGNCANNIPPALFFCVDNNFKTNFLPSCPTDPRQGPTNYYSYCFSSQTQQYTLNALTETTNKIWQVCSTGQSCLTNLTSHPSSYTCSCL